VTGCGRRCECCGQLLPWPCPCVLWQPFPRPTLPRHLCVGEAVAAARRALAGGQLTDQPQAWRR
jgi:hypothetical protein